MGKSASLNENPERMQMRFYRFQSRPPVDAEESHFLASTLSLSLSLSLSSYFSSDSSSGSSFRLPCQPITAPPASQSQSRRRSWWRHLVRGGDTALNRRFLRTFFTLSREIVAMPTADVGMSLVSQQPLGVPSCFGTINKQQQQRKKNESS